MNNVVPAPATTLRRALGLLVVGVILGSPSAAHAIHGASINKSCERFPTAGDIHPGDTILCRITVTNADTFGDALRIDNVIDTVHHKGGACPGPLFSNRPEGLKCRRV